MFEDDITPNSTTDGQDASPAADNGTSLQGEITTFKDVLEQATGKKFSDDQAAIKYVRDNTSYVGELQRKVADYEKNNANGQATSSELEEIKTRLNEMEFYKTHPEYEQHKDLIKKLGQDPAKVVEDPVFKSTIEKVNVAEQVNKSKSVLQSNPRLGQVEDKFAQAKEMLSQGKDVAAGNLATEAVIDAFGLREN